MSTLSDHALSLDIALDLRELSGIERDDAELRALCERLIQHLLGERVHLDLARPMESPEGKWSYTIRAAHGITQVDEQTRITAETAISIVDVRRPYELRHLCRTCMIGGRRTFGPYRCRICRDKKRDGAWNDRLCEEHAHFHENRVDYAYCSDHWPRCQCTPDCALPSTFTCERCERPFHQHFCERRTPDDMVLFCKPCFAEEYGLCEVCLDTTRARRPGVLHCVFPDADGWRHGRRLCASEHAWQWKIWGPGHEGLALCPEHRAALPSASLEDLLRMVVGARPPSTLPYGRRTDLFRLRRKLEYARRARISWEDLATAIDRLAQTLEAQIQALSQEERLNRKRRRSRWRYLKDAQYRLSQLQPGAAFLHEQIPPLEARLTDLIRDYYRNESLQVQHYLRGTRVDSAGYSRDKVGVQIRSISILVERDRNGDDLRGSVYGKGRRHTAALQQIFGRDLGQTIEKIVAVDAD